MGAPVLVTGASGFLGGRLVEMLAARGEPVVIVGRAGSRFEHLEALLSSGQVRLVRTELGFAPGTGEPLAALMEAAREARVVYHCAGCSTDWASLATYTQGNLTATEAMLAAAARAERLERFVHVSTTDVYGYPRVPCAEQVMPRDVGLPYNRTKLLGEEVVWRAGEAGMPVTVVRPATIYGPRGTAFVVDIAKLMRERTMATIDGGRVPGGFVYVDDVAEAMMAATGCPGAAGEAYNLSSVEGESWRQYCVGFARAFELRAPWIDLPFGLAMALAGILESPHRWLRVPGRPLLTRHAVYLLGRDQEFPSGKARAAFGWEPRVGLEEGLARSASWFRAAGLGQG